MTLEEYYKAKENIKIPEGLSFSEEMKYYKKELDKLRSQLPPEVLEKVLKNVERFQKKNAIRHFLNFFHYNNIFIHKIKKRLISSLFRF